MPKRKHSEINDTSATSSNAQARSLRLQRLQLDSQLDLSKKSLFRSLKVARGFERQKLGRRQKSANAENNAPDLLRLDAEVAALKSLGLASVAEIHFYKTLLKTKSIATAPAFPHHVHTTIEGSKKLQETASANVQARLFKSGPVQAALTEALKGVRAVLGIEEVKPKGKKRMRAKDYEASDEFGRANSKRVRSSTPTTGAPKEKEEAWSGLSEPDISQNDEDEGIKDEEEENVDYDLYASRLAQSSDEESIGEDAEGQDHDRNELNDMSITDEEPSDEESHEEEEESDQDPSSISNTHHNLPPPKAPIPPPKRKLPPPTFPPKTTTFLPSLSLSGYWSGSDTSHPSSSSDNTSSAKIQRRNRMGQQARRALWEKKFGRNANHVKKQEGVYDRNQGWDARKGAQGLEDEKGWRGRGRGNRRGGVGRGVGDARRGRGRSTGKVEGGRNAQRTGANSDPVISRKTAAKPATKEGPLHPSWEAARKAKEQKKVLPFQGKKVVFD